MRRQKQGWQARELRRLQSRATQCSAAQRSATLEGKDADMLLDHGSNRFRPRPLRRGAIWLANAGRRSTAIGGRQRWLAGPPRRHHDAKLPRPSQTSQTSQTSQNAMKKKGTAVCRLSAGSRVTGLGFMQTGGSRAAKIPLPSRRRMAAAGGLQC
jgi:hypothetical protein